MPTEITRTTCPYCGVGCGIRITEGVVSGDPDHPANLGRLCSKGSALGETLSMDGRLLTPEIDGVATDWDNALDLVAKRFADTIAEHGPDSVALYVSGQLLTEDYYAANKFAKGFLGTGNIDSNSRLCMASAVAGHKRAFGEDLVPGIYEDLELADLVVLPGRGCASWWWIRGAPLPAKGRICTCHWHWAAMSRCSAACSRILLRCPMRLRSPLPMRRRRTWLQPRGPVD
jgi:assimilatory nitrate reductase catalytic subunit